MLDRPLPHNDDAERCVLSCVLAFPETADVATAHLEPWQFYNPTYSATFTAVCSLVKTGEEVNPVTVMDELKKEGRLEEVGGSQYVLSLMDDVATASNLESYIRVVKRTAGRRAGILATQKAMEELYKDGADVGVVLGEIEKLRPSLIEDHASETGLETTVKDAIDYIERMLKTQEDLKENRVTENPPVIPTGLRNLDNIITGLWAGEVHVIAARPSVGKTAFALQLMSNMGRYRHLMFSLEMSRIKLVLRLLGQIGRVNLRKVMAGEGINADWQALFRSAETLKGMAIDIDDRQRLTMGQITARAHRAVKENGCNVIWLDYLSLIKYTGKQTVREQQVSEMSAELKALAGNLGVPVVVLCQLNRLAEGNAPSLHHLRESGAIEQDADMIALLHRNRDEPEMKAIVAKHRNGPTGTAGLLYLLDTQQIVDDTGIRDEDIPVGAL